MGTVVKGTIKKHPLDLLLSGLKVFDDMGVDQ